MNRSFSMTMKRPQEALQIPLPIGRRLGDFSKGAWFAVMASASVACIGVYMFQVNKAAGKGYELRTLDRKIETLKETVASLEDQSATLRSVHALETRVTGMGYVPVGRMEFIDAVHGYAMAK